MNTNATILYIILAKNTRNILKSLIYLQQSGFIPVMKIFFNIKKSVIIIFNIKNLNDWD